VRKASVGLISFVHRQLLKSYVIVFGNRAIVKLCVPRGVKFNGEHVVVDS